jgi:hypothetical protein
MSAQSLVALGDAQAIRLERAGLLRRLVFASSSYAARDFCAELLTEPPACIETMLVHDLLESCVGVGPRVADAWQEATGLFRAVEVGRLSVWDRVALCALLRYRPPMHAGPGRGAGEEL